MNQNFLINHKTESEWISISDLMAGLMMIFLFIAISYMNNLQIKAKQIKKIAVAYQELQNNLYQELYGEFKNDLSKWNAEIVPETLSVKFHEPDVLFSTGSHEVKPRFQEILKEFFPRYLRIMYLPRYRDNIEEIRIEGHTSSEWEQESDPERAYFLNMKLSQDRTRAVLEYCLGLIDNKTVHNWTQRYLTANGLSSSRLVLTEGRIEE